MDAVARKIFSWRSLPALKRKAKVPRYGVAILAINKRFASFGFKHRLAIQFGFLQPVVKIEKAVDLIGRGYTAQGKFLAIGKTQPLQ
jgi:hypothetical protein